jgi:hypothetical protein
VKNPKVYTIESP